MSHDPMPPAAIPVTSAVDVDLLAHAETPLDIGRSIAEIHAYLADFTRHVEWAHTYLSVELLTPGPVRLGSRLKIREKQDFRWDKRPFTTIADRGGPTYTTAVEISALEPDRRIAWKTNYQADPLDDVRGEWEFLLEPITDVITTVRLRAALIGPDKVLAAYGAGLLHEGHPVDILARQVDRAMHNIRAILEGR
jgi:hypothetical protein